MSVRMSGLISNMDTDSIVKELMSAQRTKLTKIENKKTKLTWTQEKWKDLNTKIYKLYTDQISKMRLQSTYTTLEASSTNTAAVDVKAATGAPEGQQKFVVNQLASAQYLTSNILGSSGKDVNGKAITNATLIKDIDTTGDLTNSLVGKVVKVKDKDGKVTSEIAVTENTTLSSFVSALKSAGLNANYDTNQNRLFISAKASGTDNAFSFDVFSDTSTGLADARDEVYNLFASTGTAISAIGSTVDTYLQSYAVATTAQGETAAMNVLYNNITYQLKTNITNEVKKTLDPKDTNYDTLLKTGIADKYMATYGKTETEVNSDLGADLALKVDAYKTAYKSSTIVSDGNIDALDDLGLVNNTIQKVAKNGIFVYNDVYIESQSNTVTVNGLTFTAKQVTDSTTITDPTDTSALAALNGASVTVSKNIQATYDSIKNFLTEYNSILKEMNTLYYADSSRGYEPLTDDEKESMSDDQIEKWETKIKDSLLRRDDTLGSLLSSMKTAMNSTVSVTTKTGETKSYNLTTYGITTSTDYTEKGLLHIYGDTTDSTYSDQADKLKKALEEDPDAVVQTISGVAKQLYTSMTNSMKSTSLRSALTFYNDKTMTKMQSQYSKDISKMEDKLTDMENSYYKKFSAMETALAKLQQSTSALSSMMG